MGLGFPHHRKKSVLMVFEMGFLFFKIELDLISRDVTACINEFFRLLIGVRNSVIWEVIGWIRYADVIYF